MKKRISQCDWFEIDEFLSELERLPISNDSIHRLYSSAFMPGMGYSAIRVRVDHARMGVASLKKRLEWKVETHRKMWADEYDPGRVVN